MYLCVFTELISSYFPYYSESGVYLSLGSKPKEWSNKPVKFTILLKVQDCDWGGGVGMSPARTTLLYQRTLILH